MSDDLVREVESVVRTNDDWRLRHTINLIASENVLSARARALLPSDFGHRYAEGHPEPGKRYYQGTKHPLAEMQQRLNAEHTARVAAEAQRDAALVRNRLLKVQHRVARVQVIQSRGDGESREILLTPATMERELERVQPQQRAAR